MKEAALSNTQVGHAPSKVQRAPTVSFVIPCFNEENQISETIGSINVAVGEALLYEIIIVDHNSTDRTVERAKHAGAKVVAKLNGSIGSLRNAGARFAQGELIVFIDADVSLRRSWLSAFNALVQRVRDDPNRLSGSFLSVPDSSSWLERWWFGQRSNRDISYINSGHLIVNRELFIEIGGFDEALITGEDFELSSRMLNAGATIDRLPSTVAEHRGYPATVTAFIRREIWHGVGDWRSFSSIVRSRVALASIVFVIAHAGAIIGFTLGITEPALFSIVIIAAICILSAFRALPNPGIVNTVINASLYYLYFWARAFSGVYALTPGAAERRTRV